MHPVHNQTRRRERAQALLKAATLHATYVAFVDAAKYVDKPYFVAAAVAPDGTALNAITVETTNACEAEQVAIALALALPQRDTIFTDSKPAALAYRRVRVKTDVNVTDSGFIGVISSLTIVSTAAVRSAFAKIVVSLAHTSARDGPYTPLCPLSGNVDAAGLLSNMTAASLSDHLLVAVLSLVNKEVSEHGRHLAQYFGFFYMYACCGVTERLQLLRLNVLGTLMLVALDEGPGPPIKYQYADLSKLYQLVSLLVRCCDVSSKTHSCLPNAVPLPNPHMGDQLCQEYLMPIQPQVAACLYNKSSYIKKVIEDASGAEDTLKLLQFCSWENPQFSSAVLGELLWQVAYTYTYELRPFVDLLLGVLLLEDSWQVHRIHNALRGLPDDREGLFDTIQRSKSHYQKRAYQCIKCLVALFDSCPAAAHMLHANGELKRKWAAAVDWLNDELERRPYGAGSQYGYSQWSPPAQSNETSNGYFLERSHSARLTLSRAIQLCPEEEPEEAELSEEAPAFAPPSTLRYQAEEQPLSKEDPRRTDDA
ncbi:hypothetical protein HPB50_004976 [Hyalomma asiaticum]|uniref:Uncharacterized protein n=1 Tax=Hyalomma asiaticum TaxID=266040 RepID=A0ACB7SVS8_HYAAI|nr:hypothetical protein HPB50_004976 [Hyalomma asiaticum]